MELKLRINSKNTFPKGGIFIKSACLKMWIQEIQVIELPIHLIKVFPVPGINANELFGCMLVLAPSQVKTDKIGKNNFCQLIENKLFIPENTIVTPQLTKAEWSNLFSENYHFLHPEIGLIELKEEVSWIDILETPDVSNIEILQPAKTIVLPQHISSLRFEVDSEKILEAIEHPFSEEDVMNELPFDLDKIMIGNQDEMDKFLEFFDKNPELALKMAIPLDALGTARGGNNGQLSFEGNSSTGGSFAGGKGNILNRSGYGSEPYVVIFRIIFVLFILFNIRGCDFSSVHLGSNPVVAIFIVILVLALIVVMAINNSYSSSSSMSSSQPKKKSGSGSSALIDSERFAIIQSRYEKLAEKFTEKKDYTKAAHVYMKLLKNHHKATEVLEKGELYNEAAVIHLKYLNNKNKAAECYEKGHVYKQAIELYIELNQHEKVGDLYTILKNKEEADKYYNIVVESYKGNSQYVKASLIYKDKIKDINEAQEVLLTGWKNNKDAANCLNNYFVNIKSTEKLSGAIISIYNTEVSLDNSEMFLQVMKHEFKRNQDLERITKNIAYEIVADRINKTPEIVSELIYFNKNNKSLLKDVMKYKLKVKKQV
jgi:tetratricopeptide (TPR) repeat protein